MTHWTEGKIKTNGLQLHYTRTDGDKPPVVLTHGFSDDGLGAGHNIRREQFGPYMEAVTAFLAKEFKGVA